MKCLSVSQPYADLIIQGRKTIELRTWNTRFRGEFLVHAPMKIRVETCTRLGIKAEGIRTGVIIGKVELYDVKKYGNREEVELDYPKHLAESEYLRNRYGFLLRNPKGLRVPIPFKGSLGFFEFRQDSKMSEDDIKSDLFDEEHRYQWIGRH